MRWLLMLLVLCSPLQADGLSTRLSQVNSEKFPQIGVTLGVFSPSGEPVPSLTKDDFTVSEDGKKLTVLSVEVDRAPISLALVLDTSGSMKSAMPALKAAASDFLKSLDPSDRALLVTFSDKAKLRQEMTATRRSMLDIIDGLESSGATALFDAIEESVLEMKNVPGRRIAVVFTDGRDQNNAGTAPQSVHTARQVARLSRQRQVPLWTIGLGKEVDYKLLSQLSALTGGHSYSAEQASDLAKAFGSVLTDVRLQYRLTYGTPKETRDGTARTIEVTSASKGKTGQGRIQYLAPGTPSEPVAATAPAAIQRPGGATESTHGVAASVDTGLGSLDVDTGLGSITAGAGEIDVSGGVGNIRVQPGGVDLGNILGGNIRVGPGGVQIGGANGGSVNIDGTGVQVNGASGGSVNVGGTGVRVDGASGGNVKVDGTGVQVDGASGGNVKVDGTGVQVDGASGGNVKVDGTGVQVDGASGGVNVNMPNLPAGAGIPGTSVEVDGDAGKVKVDVEDGEVKVDVEDGN